MAKKTVAVGQVPAHIANCRDLLSQQQRPSKPTPAALFANARGPYSQRPYVFSQRPQPFSHSIRRVAKVLRPRCANGWLGAKRFFRNCSGTVPELFRNFVSGAVPEKLKIRAVN